MASKEVSWSAWIEPWRRPVSCSGEEAFRDGVEEVEIQADGQDEDDEGDGGKAGGRASSV